MSKRVGPGAIAIGVQIAWNGIRALVATLPNAA
jgi:hypothetical protein